MKTTLVLSDDLIERSKLIQRRDAISFKALVEEGLRLAIEKRNSKSKQFRFRPVVTGKGWLKPEAEHEGGLQAILRAVNTR
jgi:hypothetical protein